MVIIAKCVGCGLEVNNGILEVALCNTSGLICNPVSAAVPGCTDGGLAVNLGCGLEITAANKLQPKLKTGGGIFCDPTDGLSIKFPAPGDPNNTLGCGLTSDAASKLAIDLCLHGGLACGTIDEDTDAGGCLYADVVHQGTTACKALADVEPLGPYNTAAGGVQGSALGPLGSTCVYNGCNGLVRTCDGLWAPPKLPECSGILSETSGSATMAPLLNSKVSMDGRFPGSHIGAGEWAVSAAANMVIAFFCCCVPEYGGSCVRLTGNTFTNGTTPIIIVAPGQVHRFTVFESLKYAPTHSNCSDTAFTNSDSWILQNQVLFDEFGPGKSTGYASAFVDSSWLIEDIPGQCIMGQMCITYQRFGGGPTDGRGAPNDNLSGQFALKKEYLHTLHGSHCTEVNFQEFRSAQP